MRSRHLALFVAGAALLVLAPSAPAAERVRLAILPLVVHSFEDDGHLRGGLADMLASRLGRDTRVAVLRVRDPAAATSEPDAARETARALGADYVLFGSFTHFGQAASLDLQCLPAGEGEGRPVFIAAGALGEIIPKLDPLAEKVARYVLDGRQPATALGSEPPGEPASRAELERLRRRVEALEQAAASAQSGASPTATPAAESAEADREATRLR